MIEPTQAMIEAALSFWYEGEWPDNLGLPGGPEADEAFRVKARAEMKAALRAALAAASASDNIHPNRWNIEQDEDDLLICFGLHDKGEKCEWVRYRRAALAVAPDDGWKPFPAPPLERIFVSGWQKRNGNVAGYWWIHEDASDEKGMPLESPDAKFWHPLPPPPMQKGEGK